MTTIENWLEDLRHLPDTDAENWLALRMEQKDTLLDESGLSNALQAAGPLSGWHQEPGGVSIYRDRSVDAAQKLLAGEWFNDQQSIHITHVGRNRWQFRQVQFHSDSLQPANCLAQKVHHLRADGKGRLHYYRIWQPDSEGAPYLSASVLIDFDEVYA